MVNGIIPINDTHMLFQETFGPETARVDRREERRDRIGETKDRIGEKKDRTGERKKRIGEKNTLCTGNTSTWPSSGAKDTKAERVSSSGANESLMLLLSLVD